MHIKMFCGQNLIAIEDVVNKFIKDKTVYDIKYCINDKCHSIMVIYWDKMKGETNE